VKMIRKITDKVSKLKEKRKEKYGISDWLTLIVIYTSAVIGALGTFVFVIVGFAANKLFFLLLLPFASTFIVCLSIILFIDWG